MFSSVDLPAPERPTIATFSPSRTEKLTPFRTSMGFCPGILNVFLTSNVLKTAILNYSNALTGSFTEAMRAGMNDARSPNAYTNATVQTMSEKMTRWGISARP